jgi:hypothetical protein
VPTHSVAAALLLAGALLHLAATGFAAEHSPGPAARLEAKVDEALGHMATRRGAAYLAARAEVVAIGAAALPVLDARLARATWSGDRWVVSSMAAIARAWIHEPERCRRIYALEGLEPRVYLRRAPGRPEVGRELARAAGLDAILVELWLGDAEGYELGHAAAVADARRPEEIVKLVPAERAALRIGILTALGSSRSPAAEALLAGVLADPQRDEAERGVAALSLGQLGTRRGLQLLTTTAGDTRTSRTVRVAAVSGLGRSREPSSLDSLAPYLRSTTDAALFDSALASVAALGSAWGVAATGVRGETTRVRAALLLADLVGLPGIEAHESQLLEALAVVRHPKAADALRARRLDPVTPAAVRERCERALVRIERALRRR